MLSPLAGSAKQNPRAPPSWACIEKVGEKFRDGNLSPIQLVWMELTMEC
jgi:hypothetical protein